MSAWFSVAGGLAEILGLYVTAREILRSEHRVFPERKGRLRRRVLAFARRFTRRKPVPQVVNVSGAASMSAAGSLTISVERGPVEGLDERVARLEQVAQDLKREQAAAVAGLNARIDAAQTELSADVASVRSRLAEQEQAARSELDDSLVFQKFGALLFATGVVLSTVGNVASC